MNLSFTKKITSNDKILIDTNVLIFIFCPLNNEENESLISYYSDILEKISTSNATVFTNSLIISEFINTWLRIGSKKNGFTNFKKDYRGSARYKQTMRQIINQLEKYYLMYDVQQLPDGFDNLDYMKIYKSYPEIDFNDLVIALNALQNDCKILTNDGDFKEFQVPLV